MIIIIKMIWMSLGIFLTMAWYCIKLLQSECGISPTPTLYKFGTQNSKYLKHDISKYLTFFVKQETGIGGD